MKKIIFLAVTFLCLFLAGCEYDNYEAPTSILSGRVTYQNEPVGVRSNATQLELWQDGYALSAKIAVSIDQEGHYSACLFDGAYKLVRLAGAPWENRTDTIPVTVKGNTIVDVPVTPYFIIRNAAFQKDGDRITATFTIEKVSPSASLNLARLYLGKTIITDQNNNMANAMLNAADVTPGETVALSVSIPASLASADYLFARIGVQAAGIGELYYTESHKINLK
jgi:PBP1b-binding outer membrane lipoprotein LpoB